MKNKVFILSGISGSGKSTWVKKNASDAAYINADTIRKELTGDASDQSRNDEVFAKVFSRFKSLLNFGVKDIVVDNTSPTFKDREKYYSLIPKTFDIYLVSIKPDVEKAMKQNKMRERQVPDDVIKRQASKFEGPTQWEKENINVIEV